MSGLGPQHRPQASDSFADRPGLGVTPCCCRLWPEPLLLRACGRTRELSATPCWRRASGLFALRFLDVLHAVGRDELLKYVLQPDTDRRTLLRKPTAATRQCALKFAIRASGVIHPVIQTLSPPPTPQCDRDVSHLRTGSHRFASTSQTLHKHFTLASRSLHIASHLSPSPT